MRGRKFRALRGLTYLCGQRPRPYSSQGEEPPAPHSLFARKENGPLERSKRERARGNRGCVPQRKADCAPWTPNQLGEGAPHEPGQPPGSPLWVRCQGVRGRPRPSFQSSPAAGGEWRKARRSPSLVRQRDAPPLVLRPGGGGRLFGGGRDRARALPRREAAQGPGGLRKPPGGFWVLLARQKYRPRPRPRREPRTLCGFE